MKFLYKLIALQDGGSNVVDIFGCNNCIYYQSAIRLLKDHGYEINIIYKSHEISDYKNHISKAKQVYKSGINHNLPSSFDKIKSSPIVVIPNRFVGGFDDLKKYLIEKSF